MPGVADLGIVKSSEIPQLQVEPDRAALGRYGLDMDDVQHVVQTALGGQPVGVFWDGERRFDIVLRFPTAARDDVETIRKLQVPLQDGDHRAARDAGATSTSASAAPRSAARTASATSASA